MTELATVPSAAAAHESATDYPLTPSTRAAADAAVAVRLRAGRFMAEQDGG